LSFKKFGKFQKKIKQKEEKEEVSDTLFIMINGFEFDSHFPVD
jgi:hypothetical protein